MNLDDQAIKAGKRYLHAITAENLRVVRREVTGARDEGALAEHVADLILRQLALTTTLIATACDAERASSEPSPGSWDGRGSLDASDNSEFVQTRVLPKDAA